MKLFVLIQFFLGLVLHVSAQDYVVKFSGDTIKGEILRSSNTIVKIKPVFGRAVKFNPMEAKEFSRSNNVFLSREIFYGEFGNEQEFVKLVEKGAINLLTISFSRFGYMEPRVGGGAVMRGGGQTTWYFVERAGEVTALKYFLPNSSNSQAVFLQVMGDDPEIVTKIKSRKYYSQKLIVELVREYNERHSRKVFYIPESDE